MTIIFNFWRWIILCSFPLDHRSFMKGKSDRLADVQKGCCVPAWTLTARSSANRNVSSCSPYALLASPPIQHPPLAVQMYYKLFCLSPYLMARFPFFPHVAVRSHINTIWSLIFSQLFFFSGNLTFFYFLNLLLSHLCLWGVYFVILFLFSYHMQGRSCC